MNILRENKYILTKIIFVFWPEDGNIGKLQFLRELQRSKRMYHNLSTKVTPFDLDDNDVVFA